MLFSKTISINFKASSVGRLWFVRFSSAFRQASFASQHGTLGYNTLTSRQNMMVLYGNGCGIEFNLLTKSVESFIKLGKLLTFSLSSFSTNSAIFSVAPCLPLIITLNGLFVTASHNPFDILRVFYVLCSCCYRPQNPTAIRSRPRQYMTQRKSTKTQ